MKFNWLFTLSVCISVGVLWASMYAGFESVKASYTQQIADLQEELKEANAKIKTLEDNQVIVYQTDSEDNIEVTDVVSNKEDKERFRKYSTMKAAIVCGLV